MGQRLDIVEEECDMCVYVYVCVRMVREERGDEKSKKRKRYRIRRNL